MLKNIKVYSSDMYWQGILADLGATVAESPNVADVVLDDINIKAPVSVTGLKSLIFNCVENQDIITDVFGRDIILPKLQHKIIVALYKTPNLTMREIKEKVGFLPDVTTHAVENAVYQMRKKYGHNLIQNINGKYKIGCL